jgi:hypothetical protein
MKARIVLLYCINGIVTVIAVMLIVVYMDASLGGGGFTVI